MNRLQALDIMRGLTIALMILVNTALWGTPIFPPLQHSLWNGLTAADIVFPMFVFIMGVSMAFSLRKYNYMPSSAATKKIIRRTLLIYLIGILLDLAEKSISGAISSPWFSSLRFTGVLARLAFSYGFGSLIILLSSHKFISHLVIAFLTAYAIILLIFNGYSPTIDNIIVKTDLAIFGSSHIYHDWVPGGRIPLDPEGLLGLLPSIAHVLIGYLCGRTLISNGKSNLTPILLTGAALTLSGLLLDCILPINKKIWSPTFVLVSCGIAASLLAILIYAIDVRKINKLYFQPFAVFGANPLFLYIVSSLLGCTLWEIQIAQTPLPYWLYDNCLAPLFGTHSAIPSLIYALLVTAACYLLGLILYKRKIYIKI